MKRLVVLVSAWIVISIAFLLSENAMAQGKSQKNEKTEGRKETGPPPWAPAHGYRAKTRYTYFTDQNFYYDNNRGVYIYLRGKNWEVSSKIPDAFKNVNLSAAVKVDLDYAADDPHKYNKDHKNKYKKQ
jgi:hypothetical protein